MEKIGVALSGGGIAGCAHIGVLKALEEQGIQIHAIAGTSSGGMVAALYGYGFSVDEMMSFIPSMTRKVLDFDYKELVRKLLSGDFSLPGLFKGEWLNQWVDRKTKQAVMRDLRLPVAVVATDLKTGKKVIFSSQPLENPCPDSEVITDIPIAVAVQSSCSIPLLFRPVEYENRVLVDGGLVDNCPVTTLQAMGAERVIAINMVSVEPVESPFPSGLSVLKRAVSIGLAHQIKHVTQRADLVLQPEAKSIGIFDFDKSRLCLQLGYEHALKQMDQIKRILHSRMANESV
ncbi:patatin-like phospholipase family protein [Laceyella putida]|uniref:Patatin-like phospholipase family protein n=1 Tax=Laceyella putida TaxID=110101 RepID=A0ABW2RGZ9_9BACL